MDKDLDDLVCCRVRTLAYHIGIWYETENKLLEKDKLYKIYRYLVDNKPEIQDLFNDKNNYDNILRILDTYSADDGDFQSGIMLFDIKTTLLKKTI